MLQFAAQLSFALSHPEEKHMAKSLAQIEKQIAELQKQAQEIRSREVKGVIARIHEAIAHYNLTPDELFPKAKRGRKAAEKPARKVAAKRAKGAMSSVKPKYRDEAGNTWSGRGRQPRWLAAAVAAGKKAEDFLIDKE